MAMIGHRLALGLAMMKQDQERTRNVAFVARDPGERAQPEDGRGIAGVGTSSLRRARRMPSPAA